MNLYRVFTEERTMTNIRELMGQMAAPAGVDTDNRTKTPPALPAAPSTRAPQKSFFCRRIVLPKNLSFFKDPSILRGHSNRAVLAIESLKKLTTKTDIRNELFAETERFLKGGGAVNKIAQGISGKDPGDPAVFLNRTLFAEPKAPRTPVPEVVAAIEARRLRKVRHTSRYKSRTASPKRKVIYDDFGEPVRRVWQEE